MSSQTLRERLNQTIDLISTRLEELIRLAAIGSVNPEDEEDSNPDDNSDVNIATTSLMMVNTQTMQLIKGIEDLLVLSRSIKEKWLLTQIPQSQEERELKYSDVEELLAQCMEQLVSE